MFSFQDCDIFDAVSCKKFQCCRADAFSAHHDGDRRRAGDGGHRADAAQRRFGGNHLLRGEHRLPHGADRRSFRRQFREDIRFRFRQSRGRRQSRAEPCHCRCQPLIILRRLFPTKDKILLDLTETMFDGQFGVARSIADSKLPSVYAYAVDTAIQLTLTELNENLREIYIEAYTAPDTAEYIYVQTTAELKEIFGGNFPDYSDSDFYEMDIGTAGLMRSYMARKCDIHFPLERKISRFLTAELRVYKVPEEEQAKVLAFIQTLDIKAIATEVMYKLFAMLEMKYDFKLSRDGETEEAK